MLKTYEDAIAVLKKEKPDAQILNYRMYHGNFVFQTVPPGTLRLPFMPIIGGYYSVNSKNGNVVAFNPKAEPAFFEEEEHDLSGMKELEEELLERFSD